MQPALVWDGDPATNFVRVNIGTNITLNNNAPSTLSFIGLPSTTIATYFNNQVIVARGRDEVLVSDIFDGETYDSILKSFRVNAGSNDSITAIHPFSEQQVLVFCRNSIWLGTVVLTSAGDIDTAKSSLQLLTNEIGCAARRSITTAGTSVFFLSDRGVYKLDSQFDLKLRGNTQPLSDPIADQFDRINVNAVTKSCGIYFANRYYLAVPLMGEDHALISLRRPNTATNTARAQVRVAHNTYKNGDSVIIKGANENDYNGTFTINAVSNITVGGRQAQQFNYTVQNLPATPATGEIFVNRPSSTNRVVFIYNMLTQSWESRDTYGFSIDGFTVATYGSEKRLFANNAAGAVFLLDQTDSGQDSTEDSFSALADVTGKLITRRYTYGQAHKKRFTKTTATILTSTNRDSAELFARTIDPDTTFSVGSVDVAFDITGNQSANTITILPKGFLQKAPSILNNQSIVFTSLTGGAGLNTATTYYVMESTGSTFKVATSPTNVSPAPAAVNFTTDITAGKLVIQSSPEDYTLKAPIRSKATGIEIEVSFSLGRPAIRGITVDATATQISNQTHNLN